MDWSLRPAHEGDLGFLIALRAAAMNPHHVTAGFVQTVDEARERVLARLDCARIVSRDGQDVGMMKLVPGRPDWELYQLQLLPGAQRQGLGSHLVRRAIEEAAADGCGVVLKVLQVNPARRLYERMGFVSTGEAPDSRGMQMRRPAPTAMAPGASTVKTLP